MSDCGADPNALYADLLKEIPSMNSTVEMERLETLIEIEMARGNKEERIKHKVSAKVTLDIVIILPDTELRIRLCEVEFYVADYYMRRVLLRRELLLVPGLNFIKCMKCAGESGNWKSVSYINNSGIAAKAVKCNGMKHGIEEEDTINISEQTI